jgi:hypothetical protein
LVEGFEGSGLTRVEYCRQAAILELETGLEIGRAALDEWVMRVGELPQTGVQAMQKELLKASYLQADEKTIPVQTP